MLSTSRWKKQGELMLSKLFVLEVEELLRRLYKAERNRKEEKRRNSSKMHCETVHAVFYTKNRTL